MERSVNKSIASTQGQKNKRYSVKKPSIAHFFVSQSRLTDAVSVIFGELLSYEHPPNSGGAFLCSRGMNSHAPAAGIADGNQTALPILGFHKKTYYFN